MCARFESVCVSTVAYRWQTSATNVHKICTRCVYRIFKIELLFKMIRSSIEIYHWTVDAAKIIVYMDIDACGWFLIDYTNNFQGNSMKMHAKASKTMGKFSNA